MPLTFEWDNKKAKSNARKHGVTFEEASYHLADRLSLTIHPIRRVFFSSKIGP